MVQGVLYAGQKFCRFLPGRNERHAFFLGDGAGVRMSRGIWRADPPSEGLGQCRNADGLWLLRRGATVQVGKGRQISGVILDNFCRGRRKHFWFSVTSDLRLDAERDLGDIGATGISVGPVARAVAWTMQACRLQTNDCRR